MNISNKNKQVIKFLSLILVVTVINGCTAFQSFPNVARGGDTITLAVGSPADMTRSNTTATFTSDVDGVPHDITANIRSIFKLFADPASKVYESGSTTASLVGSSKHSPWITVVAIDLPQGLTVGPGKIQLNTTAIYPDIGSHINDFQNDIEIVAGTGSASSFVYEFGIGAQSTGDLTVLEAQPRAVFAPAIPSVACPCPDYAAIEITATVPTSIGTIENPFFVRVLAEDLSVNTNSSASFIHGETGQDIKVIFTSNTETMKYYEAQFSIVLHSALSFTGTPTINSVRYFDVNGNEVSGPVADYAVTMK